MTWLQKTWTRLDSSQVLSGCEDKHNAPLRSGGSEHFAEILDQGIEVEHLRKRNVLPTESEQLPR